LFVVTYFFCHQFLLVPHFRLYHKRLMKVTSLILLAVGASAGRKLVTASQVGDDAVDFVKGAGKLFRNKV
jgi:hypothetical protein